LYHQYHRYRWQFAFSQIQSCLEKLFKFIVSEILLELSLTLSKCVSTFCSTFKLAGGASSEAILLSILLETLSVVARTNEHTV